MSLTSILLLAAALAVGIIVSQFANLLLSGYKLRHIPTVGPSSSLGFYREFIRNARAILQEGYEKYHGSAFKVARINRYSVVVCGREMVNDIRRATDDQLSFREAVDDALCQEHMLGKAFATNFYHAEVARGPVTRNIGLRFAELYDEIQASFADEIPATTDWTSVRPIPAIRQIISRTSNRVFVDLPLCRDPVYRNLNIDFTIDFMVSGRILAFLPSIVRPIVGPFLRSIRRKVKTGMQLLGPIIEERMRKDDMYGRDWEGRPNDLISWLLDEVPPHLRNVRDLTLRVLIINFGAIHTTSVTFSNTLFHLAAYHTKYMEPLRHEIETVIAEEGWTKVAMGKMRKLDSFVKEAMRLTGLGALSTTRLAVNDFTFSNGLTIPAGTFVSILAYSTHRDDTYFPLAETFQGFRFSDMRDSSSSESVKHHMVSPSLDFHLFGQGRHACPGRFFAVNELKAMVAHLILNYDVKLPNDSDIPPAGTWIASGLIPDEKAEVLFRARKRVDRDGV